MPRPVLATRYAARFSCIGAACEDSCCKTGWAIGVDRAHYDAMKEALGATSAGRALFERSVAKITEGRTRSKYALIVLDSSTGGCRLLGEEGLCNLHRDFGESTLPDVCATYPRRQSVTVDRLELSASMSCPEAARQALLAPDAMELVDVEGFTPREHWVQITDGGAPSSYEGALDVVRMTMMHILVGAGSLEAGLGTLAALADALPDEFESGGIIHPDDLEATLRAFSDPAGMRRIAEGLEGIRVPLSVPMLPLLQTLSMRLGMPNGNFRKVLEHAIEAYAIGDPAVVEDVAAAYAARRDALAPLVDPRLSEMLVNYAIDYVFSRWYAASPNLEVYVRGLILRVALVRFLVYAHPDVGALARAGTPGDATRTVERVTVEVVYRMARDIEHYRDFLQLLDDKLPATVPGLEHAISLLKL